MRTEKSKINWLRSAIVLSATMLAMPATVIADFDAGMRAYANLDFTTARKEWMTDAIGGHQVAQYFLGDIFSGGYSVAIDQASAISWYTLSAKQGFALAQTRLGWIYSHAEGVNRDDVKAFEWYQSAAELGDTEAQYQLGFLYRDGIGIKQNPTLAIKWWSIAALWGDPDAGSERDAMTADMSSGQLKEIRDLVQQWEIKFSQRNPDK